MDLIDAAVGDQAPVLKILNAGSVTTFSEVKRAYIKLAARVHSHRGGNFSKERAEQAFFIVARAWEQVKRTAEYKLLHKRGCIYEPFFDPAFNVPGILWFSRQESEEEAELLKAQQDTDYAEESGLEAAAAAAAAAACAAANEGAGGDSSGKGGSCDDDDDEDSGNATPGGGWTVFFRPCRLHPHPRMADKQYTDFGGVSPSPEHRARTLASKGFYRKQQKRRSKTKVKVVAMNRLAALAAAKLASLRWLPITLRNIQPPEIGLVFERRWQAEQNTRSWAALKGVHSGVKIAMNNEALSASCHTCSTFHMDYSYQPSSGQWLLKNFADHEAGCFGALAPADGATAGERASACKSAFTAKQVARAVFNSPHADLDVNLAAVHTVCCVLFDSARSSLATALASECEGELDLRFEAAAAVAGFDVPGLVMFVDLRKSI
jgi:curved DNA-binding protein CbpA